MLTIFEIESHYKYLLPDQLNIIVEIHNLVADIAPVLLKGWTDGASLILTLPAAVR